MCIKNLTFVTLALLLFSQVSAQRNFGGYNLLGVQGGANFFNINTDDLVTEQKTSFAAGFTVRGAFRNDFDLIYGLTFMSNKVDVLGSNLATSPQESEFITYNIPGVQLNLLGSYNFVPKHFSVEFGPILHVNGKMKLDDERFENYIISDYTTIRAQDLEDINSINFRVMGGITAGVENFRLSAQYQYGVTNVLGGLNDQNLENRDFKGNTSTILLMGVVYF